MSRLNGQVLVEEGIVTNIPETNITQIGCDLDLVKIEKIIGTGIITKGKTILPQYENIPPIKEPGTNKAFWSLQPGIYSIIFAQGCKIPNDVYLKIRQRSSLLRSGATIQSSIFDPGFETVNMGCFMTVVHPLRIEEGARVAQIYGTECKPVDKDKLYNGQFAFDKQRKQ